VYMNLPFVIWLMKGFLDSIPSDMDDAALVDGCNRIQAMTRVILPLAIPGLAATLILVFLFSWNEFLFAWALTNNLSAEPLTVGLKDVVGEQMVFWSLLSAAGVLTMLPALLFAVLFQRFIVAGLSAGAVKG
jgi:multiple sugar transport system permease protein